MFVVAGAAVYAALAVTSLRTQSATFDEGSHLPAGYTHLKLGDHRLNPEHPPLVKTLAALPLLFMDVTIKPDDEAWALRRQWEFGKRFLYRWNDADRLLFWGRLPIVALGALLGVSVFLWARHRYGPRAAALALFLCVLSPDVLAHGQLVTTDVGIALFMFLSVVAFGGTGKSALVNSWLAEMRDQDYRGAEKVFAWSAQSFRVTSACSTVPYAATWSILSPAVSPPRLARGTLIVTSLPLTLPVAVPETG